MRVCEYGACAQPIPESVRVDARFCSRRCQQRAHDHEIVARCECGAGITRQVARTGTTGRCQECFRKAQARARDARDSIIADLWADGLTRQEIAAELGWTDDYLSVEMDRIRRRSPGLLPYRYKLKSPKAQAA